MLTSPLRDVDLLLVLVDSMFFDSLCLVFSGLSSRGLYVFLMFLIHCLVLWDSLFGLDSDAQLIMQ